MKYGYIYLTTCLVDGLKYIGKHKGLPSSRYIGSGTLFLEHVQKHGRSNFKHEVLEWASTDTELRLLEEQHLCAVDAANNPEYLNATNRSAGVSTHSEKARQQISEASKRNWNDPEVKKRWIASRKKLWKENDVTGARSEKQSSTLSSTMKDIWSDPEKRKKMMASVSIRKKPRPPNQQEHLIRLAKRGYLLQLTKDSTEIFLGSERMISDHLGLKRHQINEYVMSRGWCLQKLSIEMFIRQIQPDV